MTLDNFNFYHELTKQQNYDLLIPDHNIMLVVVQLHQREQLGQFDNEARTFTEDVILDCIREANPTEQRIQHEKHNQIIQQLLHYFLWRSDDTGRYELKAYARELCGLIERRLRDQFNPTRIEKIFHALIQSLDVAWQDISENPKKIQDWVDVEFKDRQTIIWHQVEILDKKVDEAVTKIRTKVASSDEELLDLLESVDIELDTITSQINELDSVFHSSEQIRRKLVQLQNLPNPEVWGDDINDVFNFLSKNGERLRWIRRRIDRIRPRIQRLFSDLRKRDFDLKTERFLGYLLKHSSVVRINQKRVIRLPKQISLKQIYGERLTMTYVRKKSFVPPKPVEIRRPTIDRTYQQSLHQQFEEIRQKQERLEYWFTKVKNALENHQTITYSPFFYQILSEEAVGFPVALELAYRLLNEYSKKDNYLLTIGKQAIQRDDFPEYSLHEIEVRKLHV